MNILFYEEEPEQEKVKKLETLEKEMIKISVEELKEKYPGIIENSISLSRSPDSDKNKMSENSLNIIDYLRNNLSAKSYFRSQRLSSILNKVNRGNPYHDDLGKFTSGPSGKKTQDKNEPKREKIISDEKVLKDKMNSIIDNVKVEENGSVTRKSIMKQIITMNGFQDVPSILHEGEGKYYRGMDINNAEQMINGEYFIPEQGTFGLGYYFSLDKNAAKRYKDQHENGTLINASIDKTSKILGYKTDEWFEVEKEFNNFKKDYFKEASKIYQETGDSNKASKYNNTYNSMTIYEYAALKGYDGVDNPHKDDKELCLFNRGKMIIHKNKQEY